MSWNEPGGDNKDPWSGRGDEKKPPDLDEAIRLLQEKLAKIFGGGGGNGDGGDENPSGNTSANNSMKGLGFAIAIVVLIGLIYSSAYTVNEGNNGVVTRFGKYTRTTQSGLNWRIPLIEQVEIVNVKQQRSIEVGYRSAVGAEQAASSIAKEALMLTADENIVDVSLNVRYQIDNAQEFLFNVANPVATLKQVTESVQRGVVGSSTMDFVLTEGRSDIETRIQKEIQDIMKDSYHSGILVTGVNLQDAQPPEKVQNAFVDAIKAREDKERLINEAQAYANDVVPKARGAAARKIQEAEGYKEQVIAQATGEVSRFSQLLTEYQKAPEVTRKRLYIDAMESVLSETNTVMINVKDGANNMLYLPLDKLVQQQQPIIQQTSTSSVPQSTVESSVPKPSVIEKPLSFDRSTARGRDLRGRSDAE
jgi:membrane protease subunit HflK